MQKLLVLAVSALLSLGLVGVLPAQGPGSADDPPPPPKKKGDPRKEAAKKKDESGPAGDLRRAYDLLRKIKADDGTSGRTDERLRDWTDRAAALYRKGLRAHEAGDPRLSHEYGAAAHDLARAVDHSRNAARLDRPDVDLPPPPEGPGPEGDGARARRDLRHAYDRIREMEDADGPEARFYIDAARDLYNAARRDVQGGRDERAGELARASEAITHVPEHLAHAAGSGPDSPHAKGEPPKPEPPEPKAKKTRERPDEGGDDLPPPLPRRD